MNVKWHPYTKRRYAFACFALTLAAVVLWVTRNDGGWGPRALSVFFAVWAVSVLIEQRAHIDAGAGVLVREARLFGQVI